MTKFLSFAEYIANVESAYRAQFDNRTQLRRGQVYYNLLPDYMLENLPKSYDPFYNDDNIPEFLMYVAKQWESY